jgi:hypothetical protein
VDANRHVVETLVRYLHRERFIAEPVTCDALFAPVGLTAE